jgi:hypothetical protein
MSAELSELSVLCKYLVQLDKEILEAEKHVSQLKRDRQAFSREHIPDLMADIGLHELTLDDGSSVGIVRKYYANISAERSEKAHTWLRENGQESLIKITLGRTFGAGLEDKVDKLVMENFFKENEIEYETKEAVHPQTLKAFVKAQIESGNKNFPKDIFGVFDTDETVVESKQTNNKNP